MPFLPSPSERANLDPMVDDPATHSRLGGVLGLELFHVDIIKDRLSFGVGGQMSAYWDFP